MVNASKAHNKNVTRSYTSDAKLSLGAALFYGTRGGALGYELGLAYVNRKIAYGSLYTENAYWLQAPLLLRINFFPYSLGLGGYAAYALGSATREAASGTTTHTYDSISRRKLDYGLTAAFAIVLRPFFFEARYNHGLANLAKYSSLTTLAYTDAQLFAGVKF